MKVLTKLESKKFNVINNKMKVAVDQYDLMGSYLNYLTNKRKRDGNKLSILQSIIT